MLSIKKILCPTDFSEASRSAMREAADLATRYQADLLLVHVVQALPALPPNPNYVFEVPEYERALHADAERRLKVLAADMSATG
jgi:universal stress protein A